MEYGRRRRKRRKYIIYFIFEVIACKKKRTDGVSVLFFSFSKSYHFVYANSCGADEVV